jgi:hypothetical protein
MISADEDPGLRIESFAVINLRGVSTNKTIISFIAMQTYKELCANVVAGMIKDDDYSGKGGGCNVHSNCDRGEIIIR